MKDVKKRLLRIITLGLLATLLVATPVLAATYSSYVPITVDATGDYDYLPFIADVDNDYLADAGYIDSDGLDTRVLVGGNEAKHLVVSDKTLFVQPSVNDGSSYQHRYALDYSSDVSYFQTITGYGGYITIDDDDDLELGSDFEIEQKGYVNTDADSDKNLVYKEDSFQTYISADNEITSAVLDPGWVTPTSDNDPDTAWTNEDKIWNDNVADYGTINIPLSSWSSFIELLHDSIYCDKVRYYVHVDNHDNVNQINVDAYYNSGWQDVYQGVFAEGAWEEKSLGNEYQITAIRVSLYNSDGGLARTACLAEVDFGQTKSASVTATGISSGEYTVKTYGVANEPEWAIGNVLHFTEADAASNINCGAIYNAQAKLWMSFWFKLDDAWTSGIGYNRYIWGKQRDGTERIHIMLRGVEGWLEFKYYDTDGVGTIFSIYAEDSGSSRITSWMAGTWYHVLASISSANGVRFQINDGVVVTDTDVTAFPNGGDFVIGDYDDPGGSGIGGHIQNFIVGTDDLTTDEEAALYAGTAPADATDYWCIDEGTGTAITSYGTQANTGTADTSCAWQTSTFTTGKTGRLCDFYIEVDDGVTDPDRWGTNLKGDSVPDNANDWILNQNNVMPYMDYYKHTVGEAIQAWYQPNTVVENTSYDGTADAGGDTDTIIDAELTQAEGYWVNALVTITETDDHLAPEGETSICTAFAAATDEITLTPALTAGVDAGDTYTVEFGTLVDRSYYGLDFDGTDDDVDIADDPSLTFTDTMSIELWVKLDSVTGDQSLAVGDINSGFGTTWWVEIINKRLLCAINNNYDYGSFPDAFEVGNWYYVVMTWDRNSGDSREIKGYVNGVLHTWKNYNAADIIGCEGVKLGREGQDQYELDGNIDEVRLYNRTLGQAEITYNYNGGAGIYIPYSTEGLVGWWHMEEGSGASIADSSGESNTGTITGATWITGKVPRPAGNSGTNDSRITWGVNPAVEEPGDPSVVTETPGTDFYEEDVPDTLPLYDFVEIISGYTGFSVLMHYQIALLTIASLVGFGGLIAGSMLIGIVGTGGVIILGIAVGVLPLWVLIVYLAMAMGWLVFSKVYAL